MKEPKFRIRATSVMGWPVWVTKVSEQDSQGYTQSPIVSTVNRILKGKRFTQSDAEALLSQVRTSYPDAEIVPAPEQPKIVCLCGATRFWKTFQEQSLALTKQGVIVLSIGCATGSDDDHGITPEEKAVFDELHKRKIDLCDEVLVLNVGGYIGESTRSELEYAEANGKAVSYLS